MKCKTDRKSLIRKKEQDWEEEYGREGRLRQGERV
jgi:hypothetical protein